MDNPETLREEIAHYLANTEFTNEWQDADLLLSIEPIATIIKLLEQTREICSECRGGLIKRYENGLLTTDATLPSPELKLVPCPTCNGTGKVGDWHPERIAVLSKDWKKIER